MVSTVRDGDRYDVSEYVDPTLELNLGLWLLFAGATLLLATRIWIKVTRSGLWYDDYILLGSWVSLLKSDDLSAKEKIGGALPITAQNIDLGSWLTIVCDIGSSSGQRRADLLAIRPRLC